MHIFPAFYQVAFRQAGSVLAAGRPKKLFLLSPLLVPKHPLRR